MALPVPDTFEVRLNWNKGGATWATNVLHYLVPVGATANQTNAEALATAVNTDFGATGSIRSLIGNDVALASVGLRDIRTANEPEFIAPVNTLGTSTSDDMPLQACIVLTLRTAKAGRSFRGRIYFGGWTVSGLTTTGKIGLVHQQSVEQFGAGLNSYTIDGGLWILGVTSRTLGVTTTVTNSEVRDDQWDWQRSRATIG